ncbi:hypothetical protein M8J76_016047 [Diaphorina citri]|nr:hypothetical protein M8J75_011370 [Diaphorina citri]KAI5741684.1 hypothetical protein M8J76_016047 [Diaphorina citri]
MGEGELDSLDPNTSIDQTTALVEYSDFIEFFRKIVKFSLLDEQADQILDFALKEKTNQDYIKKFIKDIHVSTLFVQYSTNRDEESEQGGGDEEKDSPQFIIFNEVHFTNTKMAR